MTLTSNTELCLPRFTADAVSRAAGAPKWSGIKALAKAVMPSRVLTWRGPQGRGGSLHSHKLRIALTFDDGPDELTRGYLSVLERCGARATFFVVGEACEQHPDLVAAIAAAGHGLAGHGYTHRRFPTLCASELKDELFRTAALLPPSVRRLVRPPHGAVSLASLYTCTRAGFTTVLWSHNSGDWCTTEPAKVIASFDEPGAAEPDAIVLLHEGQPWTIAALPTILRNLKEAGRELVTLDELLDA